MKISREARSLIEAADSFVAEAVRASRFEEGLLYLRVIFLLLSSIFSDAAHEERDGHDGLEISSPPSRLPIFAEGIATILYFYAFTHVYFSGRSYRKHRSVEQAISKADIINVELFDCEINEAEATLQSKQQPVEVASATTTGSY